MSNGMPALLSVLPIVVVALQAVGGALGIWIAWSAQTGFVNIGSIVVLLVLPLTAMLIYRANR